MSNKMYSGFWAAMTCLIATCAYAQIPQSITTVVPAVQINAPAPIRIIRKPASLRLPTLVATNRVLAKPAIADLVNLGLKPVSGLLVGRIPSAPPGQKALIVILENGGIMKNLDPALSQALNVNIVTATCGDWEFQLRNGESIVDLVARVASQLAGNLQCVIPGNWRTTTFNPRDWLNATSDQAIEDAVKGASSLLNTQSHYAKVVVMEDADAVPDRVMAMIRQLAPSYLIDIHVLTHGTNEAFIGHNGAVFTTASFFAPLQAYRDSGKSLYIRAVYQMNCVGGTLKDNWTGLGAMVANGTQQTFNNNMPQQYFHFLGHWLAAKGMNDASQRSFDDAAFYTRPIYTLVGKGGLVDVSRLTTAGSNQAATVNTAP